MHQEDLPIYSGTGNHSRVDDPTLYKEQYKNDQTRLNRTLRSRSTLNICLSLCQTQYKEQNKKIPPK